MSSLGVPIRRSEPSPCRSPPGRPSAPCAGRGGCGRPDGGIRHLRSHSPGLTGRTRRAGALMALLHCRVAVGRPDITIVAGHRLQPTGFRHRLSWSPAPRSFRLLPVAHRKELSPAMLSPHGTAIVACGCSDPALRARHHQRVDQHTRFASLSTLVAVRPPAWRGLRLQGQSLTTADQRKLCSWHSLPMHDRSHAQVPGVLLELSKKMSIDHFRIRRTFVLKTETMRLCI